MHSKYIKENGIDAYNTLMGIKHDEPGTKLDNHSSTINLGLLNMESKTESDTKYEYNGLTFKEYSEMALAILTYLSAARALYRYLKKGGQKLLTKRRTNSKR